MGLIMKHKLMAPLWGGGGSGGSSFPYATTQLASNLSRAQFDVNHSSNVLVLSNGNLTVSTTNAGNFQDARTDVVLTGGKYYYEFTLASLGVVAEEPNLQAGFCDTAYVQSTNELGVDAHSVGIFVIPTLNRFSINFNNSQTNFASGTPTVGQVIGVALDIGNASIWARLGAGNWNNSGTANPATNVGGISLAGWLNTGNPVNIFPCAQLQPSSGTATASTLTFNFGATAFANTPPAGFI
jgi:hypothetical protein